MNEIRKLNPKENMGWNFDIKLISYLATKVSSEDEDVSMEQVDNILLLLSNLRLSLPLTVEDDWTVQVLMDSVPQIPKDANGLRQNYERVVKLMKNPRAFYPLPEKEMELREILKLEDFEYYNWAGEGKFKIPRTEFLLHRVKFIESAILAWYKKKYANSGDDYDVSITKKGQWRVSHSNDYPLQHGKGGEIILTEEQFVEAINLQFKNKKPTKKKNR